MTDAPKPVVQARAKRTREKLMTALEELLKEEEFERIAVTDIAKRAGVAVGSVYSHFKDKEAFLSALLADRLATLEERVDASETLDADLMRRLFPDLRAALHAAANSAFQQSEADAHILRAILTYSRLHPDELKDPWDAMAQRAFKGVETLLGAYKDEIRRGDLDRAARMVNYFFNAIFLERILIPGGSSLGALAPDSQALVEGAAEMAYGYLTTED
ncbi:MAG: TetR/AcrR family transcriptional regulator [Pseudomonadota bacterium]